MAEMVTTERRHAAEGHTEDRGDPVGAQRPSGPVLLACAGGIEVDQVGADYGAQDGGGQEEVLDRLGRPNVRFPGGLGQASGEAARSEHGHHEAERHQPQKRRSVLDQVKGSPPDHQEDEQRCHRVEKVPAESGEEREPDGHASYLSRQHDHVRDQLGQKREQEELEAEVLADG
jgi:hypothetical protein